MTVRRDSLNTIAIVTILDILHSDFEITTACILETGDKIIEEIQSIIQLKKVKFKAKQLINQLENAAMTAAMILYRDSSNY